MRQVHLTIFILVSATIGAGYYCEAKSAPESIVVENAEIRLVVPNAPTKISVSIFVHNKSSETLSIQGFSSVCGKGCCIWQLEPLPLELPPRQRTEFRCELQITLPGEFHIAPEMYLRDCGGTRAVAIDISGTATGGS